LRAVRVCTEEGHVTENIDIRHPFRVEMEYDVLESGKVLLPHFYFLNQIGTVLFGTLDLDPTWRGRPRPAGRYISHVHVPGNMLSDGMIYINAALLVDGVSSPEFWERSVVAFQVVESFDADTARGDYAGRIGGVVRPLLQWNTEYHPGINGVEPVLRPSELQPLSSEG
jgi:lipopolysaccharide transport system ATP-binding protein